MSDITLRPSVQNFAEHMEKVLRENDWKGGWDDWDITYLNFRLVQEFGEYFAKYDELSYTQRRDELADIANFCMMLWEYWSK